MPSTSTCSQRSSRSCSRKTGSTGMGSRSEARNSSNSPSWIASEPESPRLASPTCEPARDTSELSSAPMSKALRFQSLAEAVSWARKSLDSGRVGQAGEEDSWRGDSAQSGNRSAAGLSDAKRRSAEGGTLRPGGRNQSRTPFKSLSLLCAMAAPLFEFPVLSPASSCDLTRNPKGHLDRLISRRQDKPDANSMWRAPFDCGEIRSDFSPIR
jgi:hypothetical protein